LHSTVITGEAKADTSESPGLQWRDRKSTGKRVYLWVATKAAVKAGYPDKTVPLADYLSPDQRAAACRAQQIKMQAWLAHGGRPIPVPTGNTWADLIREYERNPTSRFNIPFEEGGLKFNTRDQYQQWNMQIERVCGHVVLSDTNSEKFLEWYKVLCTPKKEGGKPMRPKAKSCMDQMNRLLQFGVSAEIEGCARLSLILNGAGHKNSKPLKFKGGDARTQELTLEYVKMFVAECHKPHNHAHHSGLALATVLQFETTLRQADVIGQHWPESDAMPVGPLNRRGTRWRGLLWGEHIDPDLVLAKPTSKSREKKVTIADLAMSDLVMAELALIPREHRIGPVVLSGYTGLPYKTKAFNRAWRQIARAAGIPDEVQNRDARAAAITEALTFDANPEHVRSQTTHAETPAGKRMTSRYDRVNLEKARNVQRARNEGRAA
jgi:hypothetical protein